MSPNTSATFVDKGGGYFEVVSGKLLRRHRIDVFALIVD